MNCQQGKQTRFWIRSNLVCLSTAELCCADCQAMSFPLFNVWNGQLMPAFWCLLGVVMRLLPSEGSNPQYPTKWAWTGIFKPYCESITTKFCTMIKMNKYSLWAVQIRIQQIRHNGRSAYKKSKIPYLGNVFIDQHKIWHVDTVAIIIFTISGSYTTLTILPNKTENKTGFSYSLILYNPQLYNSKYS